MEKSRKLVSGETKFEIVPSGEEGVAQIKALLGLSDLTTNVNLPNRGQIPNLPLGAIVETNARFTSDTVTPLFAGAMPEEILGLTSRVIVNQLQIDKAVKERDLELAFKAFVNDPLNYLDLETSRALFNEMIENTKDYIPEAFFINK